MKIQILVVGNQNSVSDPVFVKDGDQIVLSAGERFIVQDQSGNALPYTTRWVGDRMVVRVADAEIAFQVVGLNPDVSRHDESPGSDIPFAQEVSGTQNSPEDISFGGDSQGSNGSEVENLVGSVTEGSFSLLRYSNVEYLGFGDSAGGSGNGPVANNGLGGGAPPVFTESPSQSPSARRVASDETSGGVSEIPRSKLEGVIGGKGDPDPSNRPFADDAGNRDVRVTSVNTGDTGRGGRSVSGSKGELVVGKNGNYEYFTDKGSGSGRDVFLIEYPISDEQGGEYFVTETLIFDWKGGKASRTEPDVSNGPGESFFDEPDNETPDLSQDPDPGDNVESSILVTSIDNSSPASGENPVGGIGDPVDGVHGFIVVNQDGTYDYVMDPDNPIEDGTTETFTLTYIDENGKKTVETLTIWGAPDGPEILPPVSAEVGNPSDPDSTTPEIDPGAETGDIIVSSLETGDSGNGGELIEGNLGNLVFNEDGSFDYVPDPGAGAGLDTFTVTFPPEGGGSPVTELLIFETLPDGTVTQIAPTVSTPGSFYDDPDNESPGNGTSFTVKSLDSGNEGTAGEPVNSDHGVLVYNENGTFDYLIDPDEPLPEGELDTFTISYVDENGKETVETLTFVGTASGEAEIYDPFSAGISGTSNPDDTNPEIDPAGNGEDIQVISLDTGETGEGGEPVSGSKGILVFNEDGTFDYVANPDASPGIDTFTVQYPVEGEDAPVVETLQFETLADGTVQLIEPTGTIDGSFFDDGDNPYPGEDSDFVVESVESENEGGAGEPVYSEVGTLVFNENGSYDYLISPGFSLGEGEFDTFTITYTDEDGNETVETLTFTGDGLGGATEVSPTSEPIEDADNSGNPPVEAGTEPSQIQVSSLNTGDQGEAGELVDGEVGTLVFNPDGTFDYVLDEGAPAGVDTFVVSYPSEGGEPVSETLTFSHDGAGNVQILDPESGVIGGDGDPDETNPEVSNADPDDIKVLHPETGNDGEALEPVSGDFGTLVVNPDGTFDFVPDPDAPAGSEDTFLVTYPGDDGVVTETLTFEFPAEGVAQLVQPDSAGDLDLPDASPDIEEFFPATVTSLETGEEGDPGDEVVGANSSLVFNDDGTFDVNVHPDSDAANGETEVFTVSYFDDEINPVEQALVVEYDGSGGVNVLPIPLEARAVISEDTDEVSGTAEAYDVDNGLEPVAFTAPDGTGSYGDFDIDEATGEFSYDLDQGLNEVQALAEGETLVEEFTYVVTDNEGGTASSTVQITIEGQNDAPVGADDALTVSEDSPASVGGSSRAGEGSGVLANDSDVDASDSHRVSNIVVGGVSTVIPEGGEVVRSLGAGTLTMGADGSYTFDPGNGYHYLAGDESIVETFTYVISDENGATDSATVSITVQGANDPVSIEPVEAVGAEDSPVTIDALENVSDPDTSDVPEISEINGVETDSATLTSGAIVTVKPDGDVVYDPNGAFESLGAGQTAIETFQITVTDGDTTDTATVSVTINGANDAPIAQADNYNVSEDASLDFDPRGNDADPDDGDSLTVTIIAGEAVATGFPIQLPSGAILLPKPGGIFNYDTDGAFDSLSQGENATDTFTYVVEDESGATHSATVTFTVQGQNDGPTIENNSITLSEGETVPITLAEISASDPDNTAAELTFTVSDVVAGQFESTDFPGVAITEFTQAQIESGVIEFVHDGSETPPSWELEVTDTGGLTDSDTFDADSAGAFTPQNDPPEIVTNSAPITEGETVILDDSHIQAIDPDNTDSELTYFVDAIAGGQFQNRITGNPIASFTQDDINEGRIQFVHDGSETPASWTLTVSDGEETDTDSFDSSAEGQFTPVNDAPVAEAASDTVAEKADDLTNSNAAGAVIATDAEGDDLTFTTSDTATFGALTLNDDGTYSYDLDNSNASVQALGSGQTLTEVFNVTVEDESGATDVTTLTITVTGTNDSPVVTDDSVNYEENEGDITGNVLANDSDPEGGFLSVSSVEGSSGNIGGPVSGTYGELTLSGDGSWVYEEVAAINGLAEGETFTESFTFEVSDGNGGVTSSSLDILITGVNDAPSVIVPVEDVVTLPAGDEPIIQGPGAPEPGNNFSIVDSGSLSDAQIANALVGPGVTVTGATFSGGSEQIGTFVNASEGMPGVLDFDDGVILSTGTVHSVEGANTEDDFTVNAPGGAVNDPDLGDVHDLAKLTITFIPEGSYIVGQYVFGSDEYNEFVGTGFFDSAGIFVNDDNVSLTPDGQLLSINTINGGNASNGTPASNSDLYVDNDIQDTGAPYSTQMDGFTRTLTFVAEVTPNVENTIEIAIGDVGDSSWDSWFLVKAGTLTSFDAVVVDLETAFDDVDSDDSGDSLTYSMELDNGDPVPDWLSLTDGQIFGLPPLDGQAFDFNIVVTATDQHGATQTDTFRVASNTTAHDDSAGSVQEEGVAVIDVTANDFDPEDDDLTVTHINGVEVSEGQTVALTSGATVTLLANDLVYNTNGAFNALNDGDTVLDTFKYTITDGNGNFSSSRVEVEIEGNSLTPVVIDMDGDGAEFLSVSEGIQFDVDADGIAEQTAWAGNDDAILFFDENENSLVDGRNEIAFSDYSENPDATDLEGLLYFDTSGNNRLDSDDAAFGKFKLWQDMDGDGEVGEGEVMSLEDAGIESIELVSDGIEYTAAGGDVLVHGEAQINYADNSAGIAADAEFDYDEMLVDSGMDESIRVASADGNPIDLGYANGGASSPPESNDSDTAYVPATNQNGEEETAAAMAASSAG